MTDVVYTERDGDIATIVLNRPERMNALNRPAWEKLGDQLEALAKDDRVRCVVLRGAGTRAFAAGADIQEFENERATAAQARVYDTWSTRVTEGLANFPHPTIALIMGACVGGGLEVAAVCDMRICGRSSRFGVPINRLGNTIAYPELKGLLALAGRAATLEILLEGRVFGADEAYEKGLVTRVVADDKVEEEAYEAARRIAAGAPLVNRWHKQFIRKLESGSPVTEDDVIENYRCYDSEDFCEGVAAFVAKRKPEFKGR